MGDSIPEKVEELHQEMAKLAEISDSPHGIPLPPLGELSHHITLASGMEEYREGLNFVQKHVRELQMEAGQIEPTSVHVCRNTGTFQWEVNSWPTHGHVSIMGEYEYEHDEYGVPVGNGKPFLRKRWVAYRSLLAERLKLQVDTWSLRFGSISAEAEIRAQENLFKRLSESQKKSYIITGSFIEESERSHVVYVIRKGLPTLAFGSKNTLLCALCLHPYGYFTNSYAGVMPPSDEALSHLLLIRSDERRYWSKSGQHPAWDPRSGI